MRCSVVILHPHQLQGQEAGPAGQRVPAHARPARRTWRPRTPAGYWSRCTRCTQRGSSCWTRCRLSAVLGNVGTLPPGCWKRSRSTASCRRAARPRGPAARRPAGAGTALEPCHRPVSECGASDNLRTEAVPGLLLGTQTQSFAEQPRGRRSVKRGCRLDAQSNWAHCCRAAHGNAAAAAALCRRPEQPGTAALGCRKTPSTMRTAAGQWLMRQLLLAVFRSRRAAGQGTAEAQVGSLPHGQGVCLSVSVCT